jgi:hypothetical protein
MHRSPSNSPGSKRSLLSRMKRNLEGKSSGSQVLTRCIIRIRDRLRLNFRRRIRTINTSDLMQFGRGSKYPDEASQFGVASRFHEIRIRKMILVGHDFRGIKRDDPYGKNTAQNTF